MRNGFIAVVWLLLIGLGVFAWLSTQDYDISKALRFAQTEKASDPAPDATKSADPAPAAAGVAPTFDIVRVESDGTAVLAGRAGAGADVTVMIDGTAVGAAKADERGEWAVVVDKPLATGNHSLTIASDAGGQTSTSEQSVAIAVPEREDEKPLIVLSQKGEPSKVIQAPESVTTVQTEQPAATQKADEAAPAQPATGETQQQAAAVPAEEAPQQPVPAQPAAPDAPEPAQPAPAPAAKEQPAPAPAETAQASAATATPEPELALRTVDYDDKGNMVFQGQVAPGGTVRVYVDNRPIADATADGTGTWTLRVLQDIEPGNHDLRVDQITDNAQVAARIELPFTRAKPEDVIASLSQPEPAPTAPATASTDIVRTEPAAAPGSDDTRTNVTAAAPQAETTAPTAQAAPAEPAVPVAPAAEAPAASTPAAPAQPADSSSTIVRTEPAPELTPPAAASESSAIQPPAPPPAPAATPSPAPPTAVAPSPQPSAPAPAAPSAPVVTAPSETAQATAAPSPAVAQPQQAEVAPAPAPAQPPAAQPTAPADSASPAAPATEPASGQQVAAAPAASTTRSNGATVVQRSGRIIIQPGNNLWNISRVIYGQGLSYTTIYQANKQQIRNPDLIYPGQIFLTPGVTPPEEIGPEDRAPLSGAPGNG